MLYKSSIHSGQRHLLWLLIDFPNIYLARQYSLSDYPGTSLSGTALWCCWHNSLTVRVLRHVLQAWLKNLN